MSAGNTIEGGLMEIKTPYRIPYVSQMAALDGVSYRHQPSFGPLRASFPEDLGREYGEHQKERGLSLLSRLHDVTHFHPTAPPLSCSPRRLSAVDVYQR